MLPFGLLQDTGPGDDRIRPPSPRTYSNQYADVFAVFHNQASLARIRTFSAGAYASRRFMLRATTGMAFAAALPVSSGTFAVSASRFGYEVFNHHEASVAYGRHLGRYVDIGMQFDYLSTRIQEYGSAHAVTAEAGIAVHPASWLQVGLHAFSPAPVHYSKPVNEDIGSRYTLGLGFEPSDKILLALEGSWDTQSGTFLSLSFAYQPAPVLAICSGFTTGTRQNFLGVRLFLKRLRIDMSTGYHPRLGITPALGVVYHIPARQPK
ncbi:hypothetical protein GCM10023143_23600 [Compostibacter hankyongensis]|uniref:Porin family protein n=2 Tax=Compostibacter hankyongensis TaxID=1007089 RepID=A0ABP8FY36_9BACT